MEPTFKHVTECIDKMIHNFINLPSDKIQDKTKIREILDHLLNAQHHIVWAALKAAQELDNVEVHSPLDESLENAADIHTKFIMHRLTKDKR